MGKITVELRPFNVPNFVLQVMAPGKRQDGVKEAPSYALSELDAGTLSEMCDDFRLEIFRKAGKEDPR
jgi:hypothetical protein